MQQRTIQHTMRRGIYATQHFNVQRSILTCNVQPTTARLRQAPDQRAKPKIEANTKVDAAKLREQLLVPIRSQLLTHGPNEQPCEHAPAELECSPFALLVPLGALKERLTADSTHP
jgi:hypothetical protein